MRQLSTTDASFLNVETDRCPMHLTSLLIFDQATAPDAHVTFKQILATVQDRISLVPAYRERLVHVPLQLGHPWWVDDGGFDVEFHVRHIALPQPGDWRQLCIQTARLASRPLDLKRPLWEMTVVEGLNDVDGHPAGSFAVVLKTHHAAVDGVTGMQVLSVLLDLEPDSQPPDASPIDVESAPSGLDLAARALVTAAQQPFRAARLVGRGIPALGRFADGILRTHELSLPEGLGRAPETRFGSKVTPHRVFDGIAIELDDLRRVKSAVDGATVNDVILSVVAGALRRYLDTHDELPDSPLVSMVPVSIHNDTDTALGNQVTAMVVSLHTDIADPMSRLLAIHRTTVESKSLTEAVGADLLSAAAAEAPAALVTLGTRLAARAGVTNQSRRVFNTVVTNVPGPSVPTYLCGAQLLGHYGLGPLQDGVGIFHCVHGVERTLFLTVTSCRELLPDPAFYAECLSSSLDDHLQAVDSG